MKTFEKEIRITVQLKYLIYLPEDYHKSEKNFPLILFLHGAGERGDNPEMVKTHGLPDLIWNQGKKFPFVIVCPQCPKFGWWSREPQVSILNALLDDIISSYRIDKDRVYLTGLSMGGFGTWEFASSYPEKLTAIAPICGGGNPRNAEKMKHLPIWVFHGERDRIVPLERSKEMVEALEKLGANVRFTVYPDATHDSWTKTYNNPELYDWFMKYKRKL